MNIAMISYWSCPLTKLGVATAGGMNVYVLNLAQALGELGHTVDIYTRVHLEGDDLQPTLHPNVSVVHLRSEHHDLYQDIEDFSDQMEEQVRRRQVHYDSVHAHYFYSGLVGLKMRERMEAPLFATFHTLGIMKKYYVGTVDHRRIKSESDIINGVDGIIASTELEKTDLIAWHHVPEGKIYTIHPGVDHHLFRPYDRHTARSILGLTEEKNIILFVGRIDPVKGIHLLIDAFAQLQAAASPELQATKLLLIGGDPANQEFWSAGEARQLRQQIHAAQLEDRVIFVGSQPHAQLAYYYAAADLVVMPSAYETFGFVALEAMACGACVLASRVGGLQYLIQDRINGRLFEPRNVDELASIMGELLVDGDQKDRLGQNAAASSYRFCWRKQAEKMLTVYQKFI